MKMITAIPDNIEALDVWRNFQEQPHIVFTGLVASNKAIAYYGVLQVAAQRWTAMSYQVRRSEYDEADAAVTAASIRENFKSMGDQLEKLYHHTDYLIMKIVLSHFEELGEGVSVKFRFMDNQNNNSQNSYIVEYFAECPRPMISKLLITTYVLDSKAKSN